MRMWFIKKTVAPVPERKQAPAMLPLRVEQPEPWTSDDARQLKVFLNFGSGKKLRDMLYYELYMQALRSEKRDDFEQGKHSGGCIWMSNVMQLADVEYFTECEKDAKEKRDE